MSEVAVLVEAVLKALDRSARSVVVVDAIPADDEEAAYIVKVMADV